jgi:hypothetical protein
MFSVCRITSVLVGVLIVTPLFSYPSFLASYVSPALPTSQVFLEHNELCHLKESGRCRLCARILNLLYIYARMCRAPLCRVPHCDQLKEQIKVRLLSCNLWIQVRAPLHPCPVIPRSHVRVHLPYMSAVPLWRTPHILISSPPHPCIPTLPHPYPLTHTPCRRLNMRQQQMDDRRRQNMNHVYNGTPTGDAGD